MEKYLLIKNEKHRIWFMVLLVSISCGLTFYFHNVLNTGRLFTHFFYIPIILASLWWRKNGLAVAAFLAIFLIFSHHILRDYAVGLNDHFRSAMFVITSLVVALLAEKIEEGQKKNRHITAVLRAIRNVNQLITKEKDLDRLFQKACDSLIETRGYMGVWLALLDESGALVKFTQAGLDDLSGYVSEHLKDGQMMPCAQKALDQAAVVVTEEPSGQCQGCSLSAKYQDMSAMTVRLEDNGKVYGLLYASVPRDYIRSEDEQSLFMEVAGDISFALYNMELEQERKRAEEALKDSRDQLEERVEKRTLALKEANHLLELENMERESVEKILRESEQKYRALVETTGTGYAILDETGRVADANAEYVRLSGHQRLEELLGKEANQWTAAYDREKNEQAVHQCLAQGVMRNLQVDYVSPDHGITPVEINATRVETEKGVRILALCRDIHERKKMEEQVLKARKMESIGTLAGGIAHEFNNALVGVSGNIQLLQMACPDNENVIEYGNKITGSANRMADLAHKLLAYARGGKYRTEVVALSRVLKDMLQTGKQKISPHINLDMDLQKNLSPVNIDLTQMQTVLSAVIDNACEALEEKGTIRICLCEEHIDREDARDHPQRRPGHYVCLTVADNGKGMTEETRNRIFEPFFTTKFQGRGLGMAAAYGIIENHDGWISVDSVPDEGTVVKIFLPVFQTEKETESLLHAEPSTGHETVLVVEDDPVVMEVNRSMLKGLSYRVLEACTGKEALDLVKDMGNNIDLVLLDIRLPDMNGNDIFTGIRQTRPHLKVIVCSGYSVEGPAQEILDAGAQAFIQKPFSLTTLSKELTRVLGAGI